jgi:hypothetical protein
VAVAALGDVREHVPDGPPRQARWPRWYQRIAVDQRVEVDQQTMMCSRCEGQIAPEVRAIGTFLIP